MKIDLASVRNPAIDRGREEAVRDPALVSGDGVVLCFYTSAVRSGERYQLCLGVAESADLLTWSEPRNENVR